MNARDLQHRFEKIRTNKSFELFVVGVIIFSALVVGIKTYPVPESVLRLMQVLDWTITVIFLVEIFIRFIAEPQKRRFFKSAWNIFDSTIVAVSLLPVEDSEVAVLGRLIRIFRVLRMVSIIPELRMLLNSLLKALPRLGYVALLMFIIFYIYAAIGSTFFYDINPQLWGDIARSLLTLFRVMTFEDWTDVMYETMAVYPFSWLFYLTFIFFTAFAFLNMIIGIVVNVLEEEHREQSREQGEPTLQELQAELREIKAMLQKRG
ncbi:MAG: ion transporter [Cellvibrionaceae bacterium]|nr:ion transporter [Cellvibrionaceae bacterium]